MNKDASSPSRTYMVLCKKMDGKHWWAKFILPERYANDAGTAIWFFMNRLNFETVVIGAITFEEYQTVREYSTEEYFPKASFNHNELRTIKTPDILSIDSVENYFKEKAKDFISPIEDSMPPSNTE